MGTEVWIALISAISVFVGTVFGIVVWIVKKVFSLLGPAINESRTNASKNLEMSRAILTELRAIRAASMGLAGVVGGSIDGDITPIEVPSPLGQKKKPSTNH